MRKIAFFAPLAAAMAVAAASPALAQAPTVNVTVGGELQQDADKIGARDVNDQAARLASVVQTELERRNALDGARIDLVLTDLKPNRPTMQQMTDRPGLDGFRSISIGGATVEGQITLADGQVQPIRYDWYSNNLQDVRGYATWQDAETAYQRLASNLVRGRYVSR